MVRPKKIAVIGGGNSTPEIDALAEEVGRQIAIKNAILICGGLSGVMKAACRGAKSAGGMTIGILPGASADQANQYVDIALPTGMSDARNVLIARFADALIAISGSYGTLSEISFALIFKKPVVGLKTWSFDPKIIVADNAADAIAKVYKSIE